MDRHSWNTYYVQTPEALWKVQVLSWAFTASKVYPLNALNVRDNAGQLATSLQAGSNSTAHDTANSTKIVGRALHASNLPSFDDTL